MNTSNIEIVRDKWGVPHIYGKTDKEAAYGLAWAHAEDDFATIQKTFLPAKGLLGSLDGIRGAVLDYAVELLKSREVANRELKNLPPEGLNVIYGYLEGLNAYASKYPEKILVKGSFPLSIYDYLTGLNLMLHLFSDTGDIIGQLLSNSINPIDEMSGVDNIGSSIGSNGFAFNSLMTTDGKSYLNINTHQPLEGPFAWYEAHLNSDEGWNMLGGLFPGLPLPVIGTNDNLGWTHTYNYPDMNDVFQLVINPKNKNQYKLDGQWVDFEIKNIKLKVKSFLGIKIRVGRKIIWSKFGPVIKTTATITDGTDSISAAAVVGVDLAQKGMQVPQQFGSASSYGKKYALGNLFLIDDTQDSDATNSHGKTSDKAFLKAGTDSFNKAVDYVKAAGRLTQLRRSTLCQVM